jgi:hypothetical protein
MHNSTKLRIMVYPPPCWGTLTINIIKTAILLRTFCSMGQRVKSLKIGFYQIFFIKQALLAAVSSSGFT